MLNQLSIPFFMGLIASIHCAGMCGPLLLALPVSGQSALYSAWVKLTYQLGRIITYSAFGLVMGMVSSLSDLTGWQQHLSVITGCLLIIIALFNLFGHAIPLFAQYQHRLISPLLSHIGFWLYKPGGHFVAGMLNGFLPCGMVYMALAASLNTGSLQSGVRFMLLFGLGTLPLMLLVAVAGQQLKRKIKFNFNSALPFVFLLMGCWFVLRGLELNIPYLSPAPKQTETVICR